MSDKYTDPKLRDEIKEEVKQGDKGGAPGQWSARKAQMMASEYKKRGGDYKTDKSEQDSRQKHLNEWTEEEWQTKDGSGSAKKDDGTQQRYLPKKAWEKMSEKEKKETDAKKQKEGKSEGKQFVSNTNKAKQSRKEAQKEQHDDEDDGEEKEDGPRRSTRKRSAPSSGKESNGKEKDEEGGAKNKKQKTTNDKPKGNSTKTNANSKKSKDDSNEKEEDGKTYGSKHDKASPPEGTQQASKDNLPTKGQQVHWKAMPGWCTGKVQEIITQEKKVDGKTVKASKDAPKIAMKSDGPSGKTAVHNCDKVYF